MLFPGLFFKMHRRSSFAQRVDEKFGLIAGDKRVFLRMSNK